MKISVRAARDLRATRRIVAASDVLAERFGIEPPENLEGQPGSTAERAMFAREAVAEFLEELAAVTEPEED